MFIVLSSISWRQQVEFYVLIQLLLSLFMESYSETDNYWVTFGSCEHLAAVQVTIANERQVLRQLEC